MVVVGSDTSNGQFTGKYDSPYHGDYEMEPEMTVSTDGKYIFNHAGTIFRATTLKSTNMTYVTTIDPFSAIAFDSAQGVFYTSDADFVTMYDSTSFEILNSWFVDGYVDKLFVRNGKVIMLTTEMPYENDVEVQSVQIFDPNENE
jgi:serine protease Do